MSNIKTIFNHPTKGKDIRRFQITDETKPFDQLLSFLTEIYQFPVERLTLRYRDDDGDDCSISSNLELREAFRIATMDKRGVLKVEITLEEESTIKDLSTPGRMESPMLLDRPSEDDDFVQINSDPEGKESAPEVIAEQKHDAENHGGDLAQKELVDDSLPFLEPIPFDAPRELDEIAPVEIAPVEIAPIGPVEISSREPETELAPVEAAPVEIEAKAAPAPSDAVLEAPEREVEREVEPEKVVELEEVKQVQIEPELAPPTEPVAVPEDKTTTITTTTTEPAEFPSRAEFLQLLASFLKDATVMESFQLLLPNLVKMLDDDEKEVSTNVLSHVFEVAPAVKDHPLTVRLLPFSSQLARDSTLKPVLRVALRKLHDAPKLTSLFKSNTGSVPYMPEFARLYTHMKQTCEEAAEQQQKLKEKKVRFDGAFEKPLIHRLVQCDGCGMQPIIGNRYKCFTCPDYDLCQFCEDAGKHPDDHPMLKIRLPFRSCSRKRAPSAVFVKDVNLPDGISCSPGICVTKKWALKNTGLTPWPPGVKLTFVSGDLKPFKVAEVPQAAAGAIVEVSAFIEVPTEPKQYTGYYRLCTAEGQRFGGRFWIDLVVVKQESVENKDSKSSELPEPAKPTDSAEIPKHVEQAKVDEPQKPVQPDVEKPAPVEAAKPVEQKAIEPVKTEDQPSKPSDPKSSNGKYTAQVDILKGMGFQDEDLNMYLLANNNGNVQRVVEWILSHK